MDELDQLNTSSPQSPPKKENTYLIPASIIVAGVIIAGAVIYAFPPRTFEIAETDRAFSFSVLADELGLNTVQLVDCMNSRKYEDEISKDYADGVQAGVDGTPAFFINGVKVSGAQPFSVFKTAIDNASPAKNETEKASFKKLADDDPVLGNPNAPITIVEFGDFQCHFCKKFHDEARKEIIRTYVDTGKANIVYRDFPLEGIHKNARLAAEAAECADEQGKFWEYHDALYVHQAEFSQGELKN